MATPPNPRRIHTTHSVWAVIKRPNALKPHWIEIGAAWINADGKGLNLKLDDMPLVGAVATRCGRLCAAEGDMALSVRARTEADIVRSTKTLETQAGLHPWSSQVRAR